MKVFQRSVALCVTGCLILAGAQAGQAFQDSAPGAEPPQAAEQSPAQLQQLVAPIALYPDALIAQILGAATYPEQVVEARKWLEKHKDLTDEKLAREVNKQSWDPSVKALTQFPSVLENMNRNLAWTSELGDAYVNQQAELTAAIQTMRQRAEQAGNLKTTDQEKVSTKGQAVVIEPATTETVYVPQYDPWLVYGAPLAVFPGWYPFPGLYLDGPGIAFGLGFGIGFFAGFDWGWPGWGFDWFGGGRVIFHHAPYFSHSRTIFNRAHFDRAAARDLSRGGGFRGAGFNRASAGLHSGAFSGFGHGGMAMANSFRGASSFGGFRGGGFHGGGGRR